MRKWQIIDSKCARIAVIPSPLLPPSRAWEPWGGLITNARKKIVRSSGSGVGFMASNRELSVDNIRSILGQKKGGCVKF